MKRLRLNYLILCFFILAAKIPVMSQVAESGMLSLDGLVYGYNYDYSKKLLKKDKQIKVEGALDDVTISLREDGKFIKSFKTNANGLFYIRIKTGKVYSAEFSRLGYSTVLMTIDLSAVTKEAAARGLVFSGAELLMNSFQSKTKSQDPSIGRLYYSAPEDCLAFEENKEAPKKQREYIENSASLMLRAVKKNKDMLASVKAPVTDGKIEIKKEGLPEATLKKVLRNDTLGKMLSQLKISPGIDFKSSDIVSMEDDLNRVRIQLEKDKQNAHTAEDSLLLNEREHLLMAVEAELANAKKIIGLQENKITTQNQLLALAIAFVLLLLFFLFIIFRYSAQRKKTYLLLKEKNRNIVDSINYASRIQAAILPSEGEMRRCLADSFVFFQPKDVVSGDFYWISKVGERTIIACVDCTGHGVPGAFMSLIGNTLLNEIIIEKQTTEPAAVLKYLHSGVVAALQGGAGQSQVEDGMDISLCMIDHQQNKLYFSGAMNPVYVIQAREITVLKPDIRSIGGVKEMSRDFEFTTRELALKKGTSVYMFTDGYMDQFGGPEKKKFNIPNFKKMILENSSASMDEQKRVIRDTIETWKGSSRQIDDMLVIGFRF